MEGLRRVQKTATAVAAVLALASCAQERPFNVEPIVPFEPVTTSIMPSVAPTLERTTAPTVVPEATPTRSESRNACVKPAGPVPMPIHTPTNLASNYPTPASADYTPIKRPSNYPTPASADYTQTPNACEGIIKHVSEFTCFEKPQWDDVVPMRYPYFGKRGTKPCKIFEITNPNLTSSVGCYVMKVVNGRTEWVPSETVDPSGGPDVAPEKPNLKITRAPYTRQPVKVCMIDVNDPKNYGPGPAEPLEIVEHE